MSHRITLDPTEVDPVTVCEEIQKQLPESYSNNNFRVVCEGKDLKTFDDFPNGVGQYFSRLANVYVPGVYVLGSIEGPDGNNSTVPTKKEKVKLKLLARFRKFEDKGYNLLKKFTIDSQQEEILHELALLRMRKLFYSG